jgi:hypothetical protein
MSKKIAAAIAGIPATGEIVVTTMTEFLETGKANHKTQNGKSIVSLGKSVFYATGKRAFEEENADYAFQGVDGVSAEQIDALDRKFPDNFERSILVFKTPSGNQLVVDGDMTDIEGLPSVKFNGSSDVAVVSMVCLARITGFVKESFNGGGLNHDIEDAILQKITLVDFTPQQFKALSAKERKSSKLHQGQKKGEWTLGYRDGIRAWHKPSTCVFEFKNKYFLVGQDEGTYFGVELAGKPQTVEAAYEDLKPPVLRGASAEDYLRQGEWFACPVKDSRIPKGEEILCTSDGCIILPKDDPKSNDHEINGNIIVSKDGVYASNFEVDHPEQWYKFVRNTAIRSVSQEGVD